jgi:hypothetical protein
MGKLVEHELYLAQNEFSRVEHEWDPTHYDMEIKPKVKGKNIEN